MTERDFTLTIDAGPDVAATTVDQITRELLETIHEHCGAESAGLATRPAPAGAKAGLESAVVGALVVYAGKKLGDTLLSELGKALWNWLKQMHARFKTPVRVTIPGPNGTITITSDLPMDEMFRRLSDWVETPE